MPRQLRYVPDEFCEQSGLPFTLYSETKHWYLSRSYEAEDLPFLQRLGVTKMTAADFIQDLRGFVDAHNAKFCSKPQAWHSGLSQALSTIMARDSATIPVIRGIRIVPLSNGQWTTATSKHIMFPSDSSGPILPKGVNVSEIHTDAASNPQRRQFLTMLGVKDFDTTRICRIIADMHADSNPPTGLRVDDIMSHALFVFHAGWTDPARRKLWFVTADGVFRRGEDLYYCLSSVKALPTAFGHRVRFLHSGYQHSMSLDGCTSWKKWATEAHSVNTLPRLAAPASECPFGLSPEFAILLHHWSGLQILDFLKVNWAHYRTWIEPSESKGEQWEESRRKLAGILGALHVKCLGGTTKPLKETTLPMKYMRMHMSALSGYSFLDVPNPDDPAWLFLSCLGVTGRADIDTLLQHLVKMKSQKQRPSLGDIFSIYRQIHLNHDPENIETIRYVQASSARSS